MSADLVVVVPLWRRTANIARVYGSIRETTPDARVLFVVSAGDAPVLGELTVLGLLAWALIVDGSGGEAGDYARKINAGYRVTVEPFIFTGADDLVFHPGWYEAARALMDDSPQVSAPGNETAPLGYLRPGVGVVGTCDLCNGRTADGRHSTHSLVARWYADVGAVVDQPGAIYYEGYTHEYVDDELVRTAMSRGAYAHSFGPPVEHVHMLRDAELDDDVYRHGRANTRQNRLLFTRRRQLWGDGRPQWTTYPRRVVR